MSDYAYLVRIVETATGRIDKEMGPMPLPKAEKVERGVLINLNREDYHTVIIDEGVAKRLEAKAAKRATKKPMSEAGRVRKALGLPGNASTEDVLAAIANVQRTASVGNR